MFASMLKVEQTKLCRHTLLWVELAIIAAVITFIFGGFFVARVTDLLSNESLDATMTWPQSLAFSLNFVTGQTFGALLVMLLASVMVAQEYRWGTYSLWLRQGVARPAVLAAKFVTIFGAAVLVVLTALFTGGVLSGIFTVVLQGGLDLGQVNLLQVLLSILRTVYSLLPYLALAFLVAVLTRSTAWSLAAGVAYALVIEGPLTQVLIFAVGGLPAKLAMWLPGPMALAVVDINKSIAATSTAVEATGGPQYLPPEVAAVGIAFYTLLFLGIAFRAFVRQDLTG
jgi:ABC-type transport system involved in multi-copper enzyme maturation permease subunit